MRESAPWWSSLRVGRAAARRVELMVCATTEA
jgi:hypothetical protein